MFLSQKDLQDLTGYEMPIYQIRWLNLNRVKFLVGGDGKPKVLTNHIQEIMSVDYSKKTTKRRAEPNEKALKEYMGLS